MSDGRINWSSSAPYAEHLAIEVVQAGEGRAELLFRSRPEFTNRKGDIHGGVLSSLIDLAASTATRSLGGLDGVATITLSISYLQPARDVVSVRAEVAKAGRSMSFVDVRIFGEQNTLAATGSVTLRIIR